MTGWGEREGIWTGIGLLMGSIFIIWGERKGKEGEERKGEGNKRTRETKRGRGGTVRRRGSTEVGK